MKPIKPQTPIHRSLFRHLAAKGCKFSCPEYDEDRLMQTDSPRQIAEWVEAIIGGAEVHVHRPDGLSETVLVTHCNEPWETVADYTFSIAGEPSWVESWFSTEGNNKADRMAAEA